MLSLMGSIWTVINTATDTVMGMATGMATAVQGITTKHPRLKKVKGKNCKTNDFV